MATDFLLGVDVGTASTKGVLVESDGTVAATASRPHQLSLPRPGWAEHDAETTWWQDFVAVTRKLTGPADGPIRAVGLSGIGPCLLPTTADGTPLRPAILYGIDTRASKEIAAQTERFGADEVLARSGSPLTSQAVGPKIEWLRNNEPDIWADTARMFMASSFLVHKLTGRYVLDHHSASQAVPMYDLAANEWAADWCADIAPGLELPQLAWPGEAVGSVTSSAAEVTGLPAGVPVVAGTIDAWAEAFSVGVREPGETMLMYGSTLFMVQVVPTPVRSPHVWGTAGVVPGTYSLAGGLATAGSLTEWLRGLFGEPDFGDLVAEAAAVPAGADGLVMLPYLAGERTPLFDVNARGLVLGLTLRHRRGHLYRAALEGTAFGVRHNLEAMSEAGGTAKRLVAVGGGTQGGLWTQIVSDVVGLPQDIPKHTVGASLGDAMLAALAVDPVAPVHEWNPVESVVTPDDRLADPYGRLYDTYRDLYPATKQAAHLLAAMS